MKETTAKQEVSEVPEVPIVTDRNGRHIHVGATVLLRAEVVSVDEQNGYVMLRVTNQELEGASAESVSIGLKASELERI